MSYVDGVLDLTFHEISDESSLNSEITQKILFLTASLSPTRKTSPSKTFGQTSENQYGNTSPQPPSSPKSKFRKKNVKAIRLGNNDISSTSILTTIPAHFDTSKLAWLDLSFNNISDIFNEFPKLFPNVSTIYLHANRISKLSEVKKLGELEHLRSLSLYGNPLEENKHYRNYVVFYCKHLHQFDKSPVTKTQLALVRLLPLFFSFL
jgi:Leucine-rich repeat (LRR) protein